MERHTQAIEFIRTSAEEAGLEEILQKDRRTTHVSAPKAEHETSGDDPRWTDWCARYGATNDEMENAAIDLTEVAPTTAAGDVALLYYYVRYSDGGIELRGAERLCPYLFPDDLKGEDGIIRPFEYCLVKNARDALAKIV